MALIHYALGDREQGYRWMSKAFEDRNAALVWVGDSPLFDDARKEGGRWTCFQPQ